MHIEIHQPELEALIRQRMASGQFQSIEDLLLRTLEGTSEGPPQSVAVKQSLGQFLRESPLWGADVKIERLKDAPRPVDL